MSPKERFDKIADAEECRFERISESDRRHPRRDVCALIYLHEKLGCKDKGFPFVGEGRDIITRASNGKIFLDYDFDDAESLTDEDIVYVCRCGVYASEDSLVMFT